MNDQRPTLDEAMYTLSGFDEIAIKQRFGRDLGALKSEPFQMMRAIAFVEFRRDGATDPAAYDQAMSLSIKDVSDRYPDPEPDEATDLDEDVEAGKAP